MESGGKPGKIHITDTTLSHLNGKYTVEEAYGEERDEMMKSREIKTRDVNANFTISRAKTAIFHPPVCFFGEIFNF